MLLLDEPMSKSTVPKKRTKEYTKADSDDDQEDQCVEELKFFKDVIYHA